MTSRQKLPVQVVERRPTRAEVAGASGRTVPDLIKPGLTVLFCGINPGLYSGATGHHFARPGNRFWRALHLAGFTAQQLDPWEEHLLLDFGVGITNLVARATASANELSREELIDGRRRLERKVRRYLPAWVAIVGIGAYRTAFGRPRAGAGLQPETIGKSRLWVLPNPSGLNANHQIDDLVRAFQALRLSV
ncbi:MAG TPA: G/U mismatch-specific DNA glycosylase [Gemmatimonadales bacterium]|nr:G/U mismatch-specific DNA glycosylase [Gemmatimonadales bacterium]